MEWLEKNLPAVLATPAAVAALGYLAKGLPVVWGALRRTEEIARLIVELQASRSEVKALQMELRETLKLSVTLQAKYDALCERDSRPPTS